MREHLKDTGFKVCHNVWVHETPADKNVDIDKELMEKLFHPSVQDTKLTKDEIMQLIERQIISEMNKPP